MEASIGSPASPSVAPSTPHHSQAQPFTHRTVETQGSLLGLATPASRCHTDSAAFVYLKKRPEEEKPASSTAAVNSGTEVTQFDVNSMDFILNFNEPLLPSRRHLILQVFSAIDNVADLQVSSAALRIISAQAEAVQFEPDCTLYGVAPSRIFSILKEEPGALTACLARFKRRLEREETETVQILADGRGFAGVLGVSRLLDGSCLGECPADVLDAFGLTNLIRLQIVNFLTCNIKKRSYNLSHYLLGLDSGKELTEAAFKASCLPLLIDMLTYGLGHSSTEVPVLFTEHPALGVKLLQLLNALLPASRSVWKYLREERELFTSLSRDFGVALLGAESEIPNAPDTKTLAITYSLLQRAELFSLLSMDIHESAQSGDNRYAASVIEGLLGDSKCGADCRLISFIAAIDGFGNLTAMMPGSASEFELAVKSEFLAALVAYTDAWSKLTGRILSLEPLLAGDSFNPLLAAGRTKLRNSLQIWLSRLLVDSSLPAECVESLVQLSVNEHKDQKEAKKDDTGSIAMNSLVTALASTPLLSVSSISAVLLRPDLSVSARCFLYTALMVGVGSFDGMSDDSVFKVVQIACKDILNAGRDEYDDSLVTVAAGCLESLLPVAAGAVPVQFAGLLISSLLMDDATVKEVLLQGSFILKWKAKWSLLMALNVYQVDADESTIDFSFLSRLSCISSLPLLYRGLEQPDVFVHFLVPVLKFASLICPRTAAVNSEVISKLLGRFEGSFGGEVDYYLLTLINRRENGEARNAFTHEILKITLKRVTGFVRSCRLDGEVDGLVKGWLEEAFTFLAADSSSLSTDFQVIGNNTKLCLGHLCQVLVFAQGSLLEKTLWVLLSALEQRLGFMMPVAGMTAVYISNQNNLGLGKALRADAQVHLLPLLRQRESLFSDTLQERIRNLILGEQVSKKPIIQL